MYETLTTEVFLAPPDKQNPSRKRLTRLALEGQVEMVFQVGK